MLPFSSTLSSQIRFLLHSAGSSTFESLFHELCQYEDFGREGSILLLQSCLDLLNYSSENPNLQPQLDLVSAIFKHLLHRPNFSSILCESLRVASMSEGFLGDLSNTLKLSNAEKVGVGLALSESENIDFKSIGQNFCIVQIEELCSSPKFSDSNEQIQDIFMFLYWSEGLSKHADSFTKILSLIPTKDKSFLVGASAHADDICEANMLRHLDVFFECSENDFEAILAEMEKEMSMADIMRELGYGCTSNISHCKEMLTHFLPLSEVTLSRLISTIFSTRTGLEDAQDVHYTFCSAFGSSLACESSSLNSWNVDILLDSIRQLAPTINWVKVMENLDHEGFNIPDETSFSLLMSIYRKACQDPFPLHAVCGSVWRNAEGQLSLLKHAVSARPDVFTFAHSSRHLIHSDLFQFAIKEGNQAWSCLDLLEVLCELAERGHGSTVRMMLEQPLSQCPEVILAAISHISTTYNFLQSEVCSVLFPAMLKDPMKTSLIHYVWRANPNLVLRRFLDVYTDPNSLLRILDLCQELKILAAVLEAAPFPFGIKLATIAFRKEQTTLEKWLNDNLNTYKDAFFQDCLKFLAELSNMNNNMPDGSMDQCRTSIMSAYQEALSIVLKVLQAHSGQVSYQLSEELNRLFVLFTAQNQNSVSNADWSTNEIEAEANAYFQQMFAGDRTVEDMVQMLARFKESPERREQKIYECMVSNLFEEYKFFSKYPDRQLKITAILFGLLIKHQLVTHLALGIALRGVLDALRKSIDSKMFMFGTKALEQFMDRLVEWPQYCNHILQISHLRSTHAELVSVIERTLARVSSSQAELNGVNSISAEMQQVSAQASVESMEAMEGSWQLIGSSSSQLQQPLPFQQTQPQLRHQGFLGDRVKPALTPVSHTKPVLSNTGQPSLVSSSGESVTNPKITASQPPQPSSSQHLAGAATSASSSPGFLRASRSLAPSGMLRQSSHSTGFGAALNIETLVAAAEQRDTPMEAPASEVQDKILFIVNNISTANMEAKAKEFNEVLKEQYYPWFAQYMVMKRASIEPNFHDLYLKFLDKVNSKALNKEVVKATYENCKVLLKSDLIKSSSEERSLLKNLGSWLGKFTIGRNQVLRAKELDPKVLIIEAYEKGLMIAVIPFTSKVLEPCLNSLAYQPPNPWTMGILSLLTEIYNLPNLKMNLKFDIEVLFKNLAVDMKDVKPTSLLKDRVRDVEGNPDFSNKDVIATQAPIITEVNPGIVPSINQAELHQETNNIPITATHQNVLNQYTASLHLASSTMVDDEKVGGLMMPERAGQGLPQVTPSHSPFSLSQLLTIIPNSDSYININPKLSSMGSQLQFQRIIQVAMDRAIKDIVAPVIQRSVTIASRTTKELVVKDYAMESDDNAISRAAHLMVGTLAGSLAHVTCKEPLRVALSNNLRSLLSGNLNGERLDQVVQILVNDHLDLGCAMIENVAYEKAAELIDATIGPSFAAIRKQREAAGSAYYDAGAYSQGPFARVPEALRPKPGRLSVAQQRVYDDFIRNIWQNQSSQSTSVAPGGPTVLSGNSISTTPRAYGSVSGQLNPSIYPTSQVVPSFNAVAHSLDTISEESDRGSLHLSDGIAQQNSEINSVTASFPAAVSSADLLIVEPLSAAKEWGAVLPAPTPASQGTERSAATLSETLLTTGDALEKYQLVSQKLDALIAKDSREAEIQGVIAEVPDILLRCVSKDEAALAVAQKVFKSLYESSSNATYVGAYLAILATIRDVCKLVVKELTSWVIYSDEERKFNREITIGLIRSELLNLSEYNMHIAKLIDGGRNKAATDFAISLVQALVLNEAGVSVSELYHIIDALTKLAMRPGSPESLQQLIEIARNNSTGANSLSVSIASRDEKTRQSKDKMQVLISRSVSTREESDSGGSDPAGFRDQASLLFAEWCRICDLPTANDAAYTNYLVQLQQTGLLKGDNMTDRFFRVLMEVSVAHCLSSEQAGMTGTLPVQSTQIQNLSFGAIDAFAKLVTSIMKYCTMDQGLSKLIFLTKVLSVLVRSILKDAEEKKVYFNPRPYFRLFINWLYDLPCLDPVLDGVNFQVLTSFANAFHALQPLKVPGFSFAWLELISHRSFMPKLLATNSFKGGPFFQRLLVDLFKFIEPYLRNAELSEPVQYLYKGTLRVLLVLLHDFPEFLCDYHFSFCDVIPPSCIQMRNVILSAFPHSMRLPDPSTPNLKIDLLTEISESPHILSDVEGALKSKQIKSDVDEYLMTRSEGSSFLAELKQKLLLSPSEASLAGTRYNVPLINSLVLYVGMQAIPQLQSRSNQSASAQQIQSPPMDIMLVGAAMDIFQSLIKNLDAEGRYLFLNAVANQLRYPNNHTHYFSFVLLFLFGEKNQEPIQEQITRVLLERLIVNRPHPWGLLITFIELIKNPRYSFWSRSFTRCAPEIEKLFESVSRSCGGPKTMEDGMGPATLPDGNH